MASGTTPSPQGGQTDDAVIRAQALSPPLAPKPQSPTGQQEFIRFLNAVERALPASRIIEAIIDNCATNNHPKVKALAHAAAAAGLSTSCRHPAPW